MTGAACLLAVVGLAGPAVAAPPEDQKISAEENATKQIAALQSLKKTLSPAEAKVDSNLVVAQRQATSRATTNAAPMLRTSVEKTESGKVAVDIRATVNEALLADLAAKDVDVTAVSERYGSIRAEAPLSAINSIAARADVRQIEEAGGAMTARQLNPDQGSKPETKEERDERVAREVREALADDRAGTINSEGDRTHNADTVRAETGVTGAGVKICALSDGVSSLAASQARGELPAVDVLPGEAGGGDEGTAMLEIIHDVAPGAELGFATAFTSDASFAENIRELRFNAGCDIIVDDIIYFREARFQDWIIAQAVNDVIADGALYFSSAGNEGSVEAGTAGHWEGDFVNSGQVIGKFAGYAHDFDPGPGTQIFNPLTGPAGNPILLNWADPTGAAANDYDLYVLNSAGNVVGMGQDVQNGTQDAYERVNIPSGSGLRLAVVKYAGADRYFSVTALRGRYADQGALKAFSTPGVTWGHSAARGAFSTAAAPAARPFTGGPTGPFPNAYSSTSGLEPFTSDGPRKIFFEADGTPITPGNFSSTGGESRQKPDITAADGVSTSVSGFTTFYGTSAAAPHAAAIAGLVLSGNPGLDPAEVREALVNTAIDLGTAGVDNRSGAGILLADQVIGYTGASPQPYAVPGAPKVTIDDGGEYIDPGDTVTVQVPVTNTGDANATSTSVVVTTNAPGVRVTPRAQAYGTIARGDTVAREYKVSVPTTHTPGVPIQLSARATFVGGFSPATRSFMVDVGRPASEAVSFAYTGAAVPIPDASALGARVQIPVSGFGWASKIGFSIGGTTCDTTTGSTTVGIDHTYVGDLVGQLISPSGAVATLFSGNGSGGNNMCQVVFDDGADAAFSSVTAANAPYTGKWRPASPLNALRTTPADGTWTFFVQDTATQDTGTIRDVSLQLYGYVSAS